MATRRSRKESMRCAPSTSWAFPLRISGFAPVPSRILAPSATTRQADGRRFVYDLRIDGQSSGRFYSDVADFSVRVVGEIDARADRALDGYTAYLTQIVRESPRSRGEYALELLTVGMVFRLYDGAAATTAGWI